MHMSKADFVETVLGGLRPIAIMCTCHDDVEVLRDTVQKWSNELVCASKAKETAVLAQQINNKQSMPCSHVDNICHECGAPTVNETYSPFQ